MPVDGHQTKARDLLADATPRPWEIDPAWPCDIGHRGYNSEGEWDSTVGSTADEEDAALIVAAVNEYEAHLDGEQLLRSLLDHFRGYDEERTDGRTSPVIPKIEDVLARLDAARPT